MTKETLKEKMMFGKIMIVGEKDLLRFKKNWVGAFRSNNAFFWNITINRDYYDLFIKCTYRKNVYTKQRFCVHDTNFSHNRVDINFFKIKG
jgi:hypothetical protein